MTESNLFKASRELYGDNSVKYMGKELQLDSKSYSNLNYGFDWGNTEEGSKQLAYSILKKVGSSTIARIYASKYMNSVIKNLKKDKWTLEASAVEKWINENTEYSVGTDEEDDEADKEELFKILKAQREEREQEDEELELKRKKKLQAKKEEKEKLKLQREKELQEKKEELRLKHEEEVKKKEAEKLRVQREKELQEKKEELKLKHEEEVKKKEAQELKIKQEKELEDIEQDRLRVEREKELQEKENAPNVVKIICEELGVTQEKLTKILGITKQSVQKWEEENKIPKLGLKAIEYYKEDAKKQKIIDKYREFTELLNMQ